jgi:hypothetical protein
MPGFSQEAEIEKKKGRIYDIFKLPHLKQLYDLICELIPDFPFVIEGNYYHDVTKCGIPAHGDRERPTGVVGVRLGASLPFALQAYHEKRHVGTRLTKRIYGGDIYFMTPKAAGYDCLKSKIVTWKHAAGEEGTRYLQFKLKGAK